MSIATNNNLVLGSLLQTIDKRFVLGRSNADIVVSLLNVFVKYSEYCINQYNAGVLTYFEKGKVVNSLIQELKYNCPSVCIYKDRSI